MTFFNTNADQLAEINPCIPNMLTNVMFQYPVPYTNNIYVYGGSPHNSHMTCIVNGTSATIC